MIRSRSGLFVILAVAVAACNAEEQPPAQSQTGDTAGETQDAPGSATGDPSVIHHPEPPSRPAIKTDSVQIEGSWERTTAQLVKPNSSVPFSAYVPEDMIFEQATSGEGEGFYFKANFAGNRNDNAFMLVFLLPAGSTAQDTKRLGDALIASRGGKGVSARVDYGSYQGRHFYRALVWPAEYGDGMGPRTAFITREWIWLNDGKSLISTLQSRSE